MSMKLREALTDEAVDQLIVEECLNSLEDVDNPLLINALHTVIAYHSVPGSYEDGKYDGL
jgi:hypothetical protein